MGLGDDAVDVAVRRRRHLDAAPARCRGGVLATDDHGRPAAHPVAAQRGLVHRQGSPCGLFPGRRRRLRLAVALSQSRLLERGILPYIVASQTVPILAIAPMVVVGLGSKGIAGWKSVAILTAYLTFFPVAINTLRGLHSVDPRAVELMQSYAASRRSVLWRLQVPSSVPYIFTALKISATASVIGAIIGETPASIQNGLGGAIVNFNQYYSLEPTFLWATNVVCAALGIVFFVAVAITERLVLRRAPEHVT